MLTPLPEKRKRFPVQSVLSVFLKEIRYSDKFNKLMRNSLEGLLIDLPTKSDYAFINFSCRACHLCEIKIDSKTIEEARMIIHGILKQKDYKFCFDCENISNRISAFIPIQLEDFKCLKCNKRDNLKCSNIEIDVKGEEYLFSFEIKCTSCNGVTDHFLLR